MWALEKDRLIRTETHYNSIFSSVTLGQSPPILELVSHLENVNNNDDDDDVYYIDS